MVSIPEMFILQYKRQQAQAYTYTHMFAFLAIPFTNIYNVLWTEYPGTMKADHPAARPVLYQHIPVLSGLTFGSNHLQPTFM